MKKPDLDITECNFVAIEIGTPAPWSRYFGFLLKIYAADTRGQTRIRKKKIRDNLRKSAAYQGSYQVSNVS